MFHSYSIADFLNRQDGSLSFHINRLEDMPPLPASIKSPHKHLFYEVLLIKSGKTMQNVDYREFSIESATLFFISQGQLHLWGRTHTDLIQGYRLMFTEDFFLGNPIDKNFLFELVYLNNIYFYPCVALEAEQQQQLYAYFDLLYNEYGRETKKTGALQCLLFLCLTEIQRIIETQQIVLPISPNIVLFKKFISLLEQSFMQKRSATDYAEELCVSLRQLNRVVNDVVNSNVSTVIQQRIILEAKRLLSCTNLNIVEIAERLGYEDASYFTRYFKKSTQLTPSEFRDELSA